MMEKVKVSKRLGIALDSALRVVCGDKGKLLELGTYYWEGAIRIAINDLSTMELAEILVKGYEVEKTPEERILEIFNSHSELPSCQPMWNEGVMDGIKMTLKAFDINVKGINDK